MNGQPHLDTGARALDALPDDESQAFDAHLARCTSCTEEYREFTETVALLGAAAAVDPPASLHRSLMQLINRTPQSPPAVGDPRHDSDRAVIDRRPPPQRRWYRRPPTLLVAAVAALLIVAGGVIAVLVATDSPPTAEQCVQQAADATVLTPTVGDGGSVQFAPSCRAAVVITPQMPALPADSDYQLWVMAGDRATSVGLIPATAAPSGVVVPVAAGDTAVGVSVEPSGGSPAPTTAPIWVVALAE